MPINDIASLTLIKYLLPGYKGVFESTPKSLEPSELLQVFLTVTKCDGITGAKSKKFNSSNSEDNRLKF